MILFSYDFMILRFFRVNFVENRLLVKRNMLSIYLLRSEIMEITHQSGSKIRVIETKRRVIVVKRRQM